MTPEQFEAIKARRAVISPMVVRVNGDYLDGAKADYDICETDSDFARPLAYVVDSAALADFIAHAPIDIDLLLVETDRLRRIVGDSA